MRSNRCIPKRKKKKLALFERSSNEEGTQGTLFSRLCVSPLMIVFFLILPSTTNYLHSLKKKNKKKASSAELCINQNSIVLVSELNKFHKQERRCMQKEHIIQSQTANQARVTQMKIPAELQSEELFGTTVWPSTPTFATTQPDKVLFCIFKRPSYCVNSAELQQVREKNHRLLPILTELNTFYPE